MVGSAIVRALSTDPTVTIITRSRAELDLTRQSDVEAFFGSTPIDAVYVAAAKVGGIMSNSTYPADFIIENLQIQNNVMTSAYKAGVSKLLFLGSSCIYPKAVAQPMAEEALLTGVLEPTNDAYAIAKIAGVKLCEAMHRQYGCDFRSAMPTNLYGPNDNYHQTNSHVLPALLRRFHEATAADAQEVVVWGSGTPLREFLHVDDLANACLFLMKLERETYVSITTQEAPHINVGSGEEHTIAEMAHLIADVVGYGGKISFDTSKPDGTMRKLMRSDRLRALGWKPTIPLREGLRSAYDDFLKSYPHRD